VLVADYQECNLVKKLSSIFTQTLEEKVDTDTLTYADVPPSILYVSNPDLHWLF